MRKFSRPSSSVSVSLASGVENDRRTDETLLAENGAVVAAAAVVAAGAGDFEAEAGDWKVPAVAAMEEAAVAPPGVRCKVD